VGAEQKRFVVHKQIIANRSAFFRAALDRTFKEADDNTVQYPDCTPDVFAIYVQWIYSGAIVLLDTPALETDVLGSEQRKLLLGLYILADKLRDAALRNRTIDAYITSLHKAERSPGVRAIKRVWDNTPESSQLRKLLLNYALHTSGECLASELQTNRESLPPAYMTDVAIAFAKADWDKSKLVWPHKSPACTYHDHDLDDPPCLDQKRGHNA